MTARHGLWVANGSAGVTSPQDARLADAALLTGPGIMYGTGVAAVTGSTSGPNMKYIVPSAVYVTQRGTLSVDGLYRWANAGALTVDSGTPAPSSGTRWDLIWAKHNNANDGFSDANSDPSFGVTVGTAGATPVKPYASIPAGALVLAEASVGTSIANGSLATITQVFPWVVARGAAVPVRSQAERDALTAFSGLRVVRLDTTDDVIETYGGTSWTTGDTGWISLTNFQNGFTIPTGGSPAYVAEARQVGKLVKLRGYLTNSTFNSSTPTTGAVLPTGIGRPNVNEQPFPVANNNSTVGRAAFAQPGGSIQFTSTAATSAFYSLGGISYFVD